MAGEELAFRRVALGAPVADYARAVDRLRVNLGGRGPGFYQQADTTTSLPGVTLTAHATPHTKGTWLEIGAPTTFPAETIIVIVTAGTTVIATATSVLLDIGYGPNSGAVTTIAANLNAGYGVNGQTFTLRYALPSGSQIWGRIQALITVDTLGVSAQVHQAGTNQAAPTTITTYGADTATSNGVTLTAPGSTNTKPTSFDTITASTTADTRHLLATVALPAGTTGATASTGLFDIAVGAAASEVVIMGDIPFTISVNEFINYFFCSVPLCRSIPVGTRLSGRYQSTSTTAGGRISVILHGMG